MNEWIQVFGAIACIVVAFYFIRWTSTMTIKRALAKEGFETTAVVSEIGDQKIITAKGEHGETLVAKITKVPESLVVRVKSVLVPTATEEYYYLEIDGKKHVSAERI